MGTISDENSCLDLGLSYFRLKKTHTYNRFFGLEFKNVKAGKDGWGMEKKIVW